MWHAGQTGTRSQCCLLTSAFSLRGPGMWLVGWAVCDGAFTIFLIVLSMQEWGSHTGVETIGSIAEISWLCPDVWKKKAKGWKLIFMSHLSLQALCLCFLYQKYQHLVHYKDIRLTILSDKIQLWESTSKLFMHSKSVLGLWLSISLFHRLSSVNRPWWIFCMPLMSCILAMFAAKRRRVTVLGSSTGSLSLSL